MGYFSLPSGKTKEELLECLATNASLWKQSPDCDYLSGFIEQCISKIQRMEKEKMLTVYSKPSCPFCVRAKNYLQSKNIQFNEIDVTQDKESLAFIKARGHRTVPQLYMNGELFVEGGYEGLVNLPEVDLQKKLEKPEKS